MQDTDVPVTGHGPKQVMWASIVSMSQEVYFPAERVQITWRFDFYKEEGKSNSASWPRERDLEIWLL